MVYEGHYRKLYDIAEKGKEAFKDLATFVVDNDCKTSLQEPITGVQRDVLISEFSEDMALGSIFTRNKYLLIGGLAGAAITIGVVVTYKIIKNRKKEEG